MPHLAPADLTAALNWRYATKKFDPAREIPAEIWSALEHSLVFSPSSMGLQPWKFFVIRSPELKQRLVPASHGQTQPVDCSHYVVFTYYPDISEAHAEKYLARIREVRGTTEEAQKGHRDSILGNLGKARKANILNDWQSKQVYIALGHFIASAAVLGVDTCPMEGIDHKKYDEILGLKEQGLTTLVCCAAGYRSAADKYAAMAKVRFPASDVVTYL